MIYTMPRKPAALPVASSYVDRALLAELVASPHKVTAYAEAIWPQCASLQRSVARGGFYTRKSLRQMQILSQTVLRAARACRDLTPDDLRNLDRLHAFVRGIQIGTTKTEAA